MVKTVTDTHTAIEEKNFLEKAVKILTSLGLSYFWTHKGVVRVNDE